MTNKSITPNEQFNFSNSGLIIEGQPTFEQWHEAGKWLKYVEGAIQWWIGDWLNYGETRWGEMYTQALEETDYAKGTLRNQKYIADKIPPSRRNDKLHYSHHIEVASLEPEQQIEMLDLAEQECLTARQLRQKVKALKMQNGNNDIDEYRRLVNQCINIIDVLNENYKAGIIEIRMYLENSL